MFAGGIDVDSDDGRLAFSDVGDERFKLGGAKRADASKNFLIILIINIYEDHRTVCRGPVDAKLGVGNDPFDTVKHTGVAEYPG
jgi:hypothetical protein